MCHEVDLGRDVYHGDTMCSAEVLGSSSCGKQLT